MKSGLQNLWALAWRTCCLLLLWQGAMAYVFKKPARFAESNFVSNQIRLQSLISSNDDGAVLLGSSIIARLDPHSITDAAELNQTIQLGLDGGHLSLGLQILEQLEKTPEFLVLEANTLGFAATPNDALLLTQSEDPIFHLAERIPWVRAENRPSAVLYSRLKEWKDSRGQPPADSQAPVVSFQIAHPLADPLTLDLRKEVALFVKRIDAIGTPWDQVLLVFLPDGQHARTSQYLMAQEIHRLTGVRILDLKGHAGKGDYRFTDGLHLDLPSGKKASEAIGHAVAKMR